VSNFVISVTLKSLRRRAASYAADSQKAYTACVRSSVAQPPLMPRRLAQPFLKAALVATLAAAAFVGAAAHAPAAQAATPCWKTLLNDWYDGRIDHVYPVHCYREALKHLPTDVSTYSSAHDDILRALQSAIAKQKKEHKTVNDNSLVPAQGGGSNGGSSSGGGTTTGPGGSDAGGRGKTTTTNEPGRTPGGGLAGQVSSSNPSSIPTPLLILGGLALLLVAAGAAGLIAKRVQARRRPS
jgi:hypothetical protein